MGCSGQAAYYCCVRSACAALVHLHRVLYPVKRSWARTNDLACGGEAGVGLTSGFRETRDSTVWNIVRLKRVFVAFLVIVDASSMSCAPEDHRNPKRGPV